MITLKQKITIVLFLLCNALIAQPWSAPQTGEGAYWLWASHEVPNVNLSPATGDQVAAVNSSGVVVGLASGADEINVWNNKVYALLIIHGINLNQNDPIYIRYYDSSENEVYTIGSPVESQVTTWPGDTETNATPEYIQGFSSADNTNLVYNQPQQNPSPVTLKNFRVGKSTCEVIDIEWTTVSEINNDGWNIEKSYDGRSWEEIGFVAGKGTSGDLQKYTFTDRAIEDGYSSIYYRLNQVDLDGRSTMSDVVKTSIDCAGDFSFFPNPASSMITLNNMGTGQVDILSVSGKRVATGITSDEYDVSHLNKGVYLVRYRLNQTILHKKLIIQ